MTVQQSELIKQTLNQVGQAQITPFPKREMTLEPGLPRLTKFWCNFRGLS